MARLQGKVAIITGASGGIGAASAKRFVEEGASVMLVDLEDGPVQKVAQELGSDRAAAMAADVSDPEQVRRFVAATAERFGGIDVMFANAGIEGAVAPLTAYPRDTFDRVLAVNVRGPFLAIQEAVPHLERRGGGSIIVTSSVAGLLGARGLGAYVASKHAVMGLMKVAAQELGPLNIRVNTINPGPIENRMMRSIEQQAAPDHADQVKAGFVGRIPLGRYGLNEEVASLAVFLASDESSYSTGSAFVLDGGYASG
jgi:NAD(P)-dependent dehydrogenase (short-subunit alcohol dehydrogenase family)